MDKINKIEYEYLEQEVGQYINRFQKLDKLGIPVKVRIDLPVSASKRFAQEPFEINVSLLLAILSGWQMFQKWLKEKYGDEDGTIDTSIRHKFGYKFFKILRIAINALKYVIFGVIKAVNERSQ